MDLFGFEIRRKDDPAEEQQKQPSFAPEVHDDGAVVVAAGGVYGTYVDLEGSVKSEAELVRRYREMATHPEVDSAIDDIVNEAIVKQDDRPIVQVDLSDTDLSANIKKLVRQEFDEVMSLLSFNVQGYDVFRRWYVDGRLYYHLIIDVENPRDGIKEIRYIDPRKIRKIREVRKTRNPNAPSAVPETANEYYVYNDKGYGQANTVGSSSSTTQSGLKIAKDSVVHVTSGLLDPAGSVVLSHLHKAIKPLNQLRTLEDATVIYRISRAPERRIFYIDVGNLPKMKAEQYLRDMMVRHKNKVVYDSATGELRDDRKFMTMLEDYWLPRREGNKGTEITTLPAGQNLGQMDDVIYFQKNLYKSLNVPDSRLEKDNGFVLGEQQEVSRDEIKFAKFIKRLRTRFNKLFLEALGKQIVLKGVMTVEEWEAISNKVDFNYAQDNQFEELKETQILRSRAQTLQLLEPYAGKYFSHTWLRKHVLMHTDDDIEEMDQEIADEQELEQYNPPADQAGQGQPETPQP